METQATTAVVARLRAAWAGLVEHVRHGLGSLRGSPRGLYIFFGIELCTNLSGFLFNGVLALLLTDEFGVSDKRTGAYYGLLSTLTLCSTFCLGAVVDRLGWRTSLRVGLLFSGVAKLVVGVTASRVRVVFVMPPCFTTHN